MRKTKNRIFGIFRVGLIVGLGSSIVLQTTPTFVQGAGPEAAAQIAEMDTISGHREDSQVVVVDSEAVELIRWHIDHPKQPIDTGEAICGRAWDVVMTGQEVDDLMEEGILADAIKERSKLLFHNLNLWEVIDESRIWLDISQVESKENLAGYQVVIYVDGNRETVGTLEMFVKVVGNSEIVSPDKHELEIINKEIVKFNNKAITINQYEQMWTYRSKALSVTAWDVWFSEEEVDYFINNNLLEDEIHRRSKTEAHDQDNQKRTSAMQITVEASQVKNKENLDGYNATVFVRGDDPFSTESEMPIKVKVVGEYVEPTEPPPQPPPPPIIVPDEPSDNTTPSVRPSKTPTPSVTPSATPTEAPSETPTPTQTPNTTTEVAGESQEPLTTEEQSNVPSEKAKMSLGAKATVAAEGVTAFLLSLSVLSDIRILRWLRRK